MSYAMKFVGKADGTCASFAAKELKRLIREGQVKESRDGYYYVKSNVPTMRIIDGKLVATGMRWDLIPHNYLQGRKISPDQAIRDKNSRAIDPKTGRSSGFNSFNARLDTVRSLPAFRDAWAKGQRCLIPVDAFRERPHQDDAPLEFKGRDYDIELPETMFFAGLWDLWNASENNGFILSCTALTTSSKGIKPLEDIWHDRVPILLTEAEGERWMNPETTPESAFEMCKPIEGKKLSVKDITPPTIQQILL